MGSRPSSPTQLAKVELLTLDARAHVNLALAVSAQAEEDANNTVSHTERTQRIFSLSHGGDLR